MPLVGFKFKLFLKTGCKYREFFGFSKLLIWPFGGILRSSGRAVATRHQPTFHFGLKHAAPSLAESLHLAIFIPAS
jgi:hypothetical protein